MTVQGPWQIEATGCDAFFHHVAARAADACRAHVGGRLDVEVVLFSLLSEGRTLARARGGPCDGQRYPVPAG